MQVRVLGCSGSIAQGNRTTSFLVDDDILIDAGTGVGDLSLDELVRIDHVFVSHSHLDHIVAIPLLADAVSRLRRTSGRPPIRVHALPQTLAALRQHVFNGVIWPDFTALPEPGAPAIALDSIELGQTLRLGPREIQVLPARHTVPAVGYALRRRLPREVPSEEYSPWWVFTGDTGPNPALWRWMAKENVATLIIETAFSDDEQDMAELSQHLCPQLLKHELAQLTQPAQVYITHIKPGETDRVMAQLQALGLGHPVRPLTPGLVMPVAEKLTIHVS